MTSPGFSSVIGEWVLVLGAAAVAAGVVLTAARRPSIQADVASVDAVSEVERPFEVKRASQTDRPAPQVSKRSTAAVPPMAAVQDTDATSVTITGCLELDDDTFWLKDASGVDMPKSRSWRSGFLKKRQPAVELVDNANSLKLSNHVGQRVAATGTLVDRQMRTRSLSRVAVSCK